MTTINFDPDSFGIVFPTILTGPEGIKKIEMLIDTGATLCIIPFDIAIALGYNPSVSKEYTDITTASGSETMPLIKIEKLSLMGKEIQNVKTLCHDLPPTSRVDGLLGLSYLKHFKLTIDFKAGILALE
jgi:clan AA aspartic protease (TIGR02281 family)